MLHRALLLLLPLLLIAASDGPPGTNGLSGLAVPRWASLSAGEARMRAGPGENYPITWVYRRAGLPVRVVREYDIWRQVEDPEGTRGWMNRVLITGPRTAMIKGGLTPLHAEPGVDSRVLWQAEAGVIGKIDRCRDGWCEFEVGQRAGYVQIARLWGVDPSAED